MDEEIPAFWSYLIAFCMLATLIGCILYVFWVILVTWSDRLDGE